MSDENGQDKPRLTVASLHAVDWHRMSDDVSTRIHYLAGMCRALKPGEPMSEQIANDLVAPLLMHLMEFCTSISTEQEGEEDGDGP